MKSRILYHGIILAIALLSGSCKGNAGNGANTKSTPDSSPVSLWNISILLDLSDRISPEIHNVYPTHIQRDSAAIAMIVNRFMKQMDKPYIKMKDKIRVLFYPAPSDPNINRWASSLNVDFEGLDVAAKGELYKHLPNVFATNVQSIYDAAARDNTWLGADIWKFFNPNSGVDLCILDPKKYRNILIIITDGYLYHKNTQQQTKQRYSYLTSKLLRQTFGNSDDWQEKSERINFGLIANQNNLQDLDVLFLELDPIDNHQEDMLKYFLGKWASEMNVNRCEMYVTDPVLVNTQMRIEKFFK